MEPTTPSKKKTIEMRTQEDLKSSSFLGIKTSMRNPLTKKIVEVMKNPTTGSCSLYMKATGNAKRVIMPEV